MVRRFMVLAMVLAAGLAGATETDITGFVDASLYYDDNSGDAAFGLDQIEIDVTRVLSDVAVIRADLEWVKDGDGWAQDLEQGYLEWSPVFAPDLALTFGKFNAPMGFEMLDPHEMYQFSHALVYDHGLPANLTGVMARHPLGERLAVSGWVVNGWDSNDLSDGNPETFGGRLDVSLNCCSTIGVSVISGTEICDSGFLAGDPAYFAPYEFERTVIDIDATLTPAEDWTVGGEFNQGAYEAGATKADWAGLMVMAHYDVNAWFGLTGRCDWFDDPDGHVFGAGIAETRTALTIAPTFVLGDGVGALIELRLDGSDLDRWTDADGNPTDSRLSIAFETTSTF